MINYIRQYYEYLLLVCLYYWICYCAIFNMGSTASIVFLLLTICLAITSTRASLCVMILLLFSSMASLNMPSPIILSSAIIFLCNLNRMTLKGKSLVLSKLYIPFLAYFFIRFASTLQCVNYDMYISAISTDCITLVSITLAILLINDSKDTKFIERWIGILGVLATIYGLLYFLYNESAYLGQMYIGTDFAGKGVIGDVVMAWLRWVPIDKEPNFWAACMMFPFGYWLYQVSRKVTVVSLACLVVVYIGILFSYSRSSFLVSSIVLLYMLFLKSRRNLIYIVIAFIAIFLCIYYYSPELVERIFSIKDNIKSEGGSGRFELWSEAIDNFFRNPVFGVGAGQTPAYSLSRMGTHNLYLQILGENGILGFFIFMFIWISAFKQMKKFKTINSFYFYSMLGYSINLMTVHNFDLRIPFFVLILFYQSLQIHMNSSSGKIPCIK